MKRVIKDSKLSISVHYYNMYTYKHRHYTLTRNSESHNSVHSILHRVPAGFYKLLSISKKSTKISSLAHTSHVKLLKLYYNVVF